MWLVIKNEMINLKYIESINYVVCSEGGQFELDFYKNGKIVSYLFFDNENEVKKVFLNIKLALKNDKKFLEL